MFSFHPVWQRAFKQPLEFRTVVVVEQVTQLMDDNVFNTLTRRLDEFRVQRKSPIFTETSPAIFCLYTGDGN